MPIGDRSAMVARSSASSPSIHASHGSDQDISVAVVLADVATSYVLNAAKLHDQGQLSEQLQQALESRVVIEQAKGITAQRKSVTVDHAYQLMRGHARSNHAKPAHGR